MEIRLQKWGNSDGIRIPSIILKNLGIKTNDKLNITQEEDRIVISKSKRPKISLEERFKKYYGDMKVEPYDWGEPMGKEIW